MIISAKTMVNKFLNYKFYHSVEEEYALELNLLRKKMTGRKNSTARLAVILHLYYQEGWIAIETKLKNITENFDLFITMPTENKKLAEKVKHSYPDAYFIKTPNLGRDILPFLKTMTVVRNFDNYKLVLKVHTKKSPHREDGDDWNNEILDELIPNSKYLIKENINNLIDNFGALTGPAKQYVSLAVNFETNGKDMTKIMKKLFKNRQLSVQVLQTNRLKYGFFAGSMLWMNIDKLSPLFDDHNCRSKYFARERGQIDGTYAHAMERMFSLYPEINKNDLYKMEEIKISKLNSYRGSIPDWFRDKPSDDY